jgi:hypothetical protein
VSRRGRSGASWWQPVLVIVLPVLIGTAAAVIVLLRVLAPGTAPERLDTVRTGLAIGAGIGALITLALAWRRQQATEHDATERRLTELYVKAVDQLGSDKATVRQGGLYALERVAQDNPDHRQTIVEVICAYLRAPYTPPTDTSPRKLNSLRAPLRPTRTRTRPLNFTPAATPPASTAHEPRQELEVRLTAQRILSHHLQPRLPARTLLRWFPRPAATFWPDIDLELTGATLIDLDLSHTTIRTAQFRNARFNGGSDFIRTRFTWRAEFSHTRFSGFADFLGARFATTARFNHAQFDKLARFSYAQFHSAMFDNAQFDNFAQFDSARFSRSAAFIEARFATTTQFDNAQFGHTAWFDDAQFGGNVSFTKTQFSNELPDELKRHLESNEDITASADTDPTEKPTSPSAG